MGSFREKTYTVIFGTDTRLGKAFDVILLWAILISVLIVILESVSEFRISHGGFLKIAEWFFTILFLFEYALRIYSERPAKKYILSFFGLVDLISILPAFLGLIFTGAQSLMVIRALRLLRIFRVLKLGRFMGQASTLMKALSLAREKIIVFIGAVLIIAVVMGSIMYLIEGEASGFTSIPRGIYWAVVTMTTVGYGDITPKTELGQFLSGALMILGYGIIAIPTGIVSAEYAMASERQTLICRKCKCTGFSRDSKFCNQCGESLL